MILIMSTIVLMMVEGDRDGRDSRNGKVTTVLLSTSSYMMIPPHLYWAHCCERIDRSKITCSESQAFFGGENIQSCCNFKDNFDVPLKRLLELPFFPV